MQNRDLVMSKLNLVRNALQVGVQHSSLLRHAVQDDDVDGMVRYREALHNALELVNDMMGEIGRDLPDWRPVSACTAQADGGGRFAPDNHLGATEA